ncbi:MAG: hypothetical protein QNJ90_01430 [Planctomycetota bacterium]|nr:hypothetical protein [Planctomycetota bacterium]
MRMQTLVQIFKSLGVALLVAGILFGAAIGWDADGGIRALWLATGLAFFATAVGLVIAAALRDARARPDGAPTAFRVGLGVSWLLMLLFSAPFLLSSFVTPLPYLIWLVLHAVGQLVLQMVTFRGEDPDEVARRTKLNAGMTP